MHCVEKIISACLHAASVSAERVGQREVGWSHLQGDMHMVAKSLGCKSTIVGTRWANSCLGCMNRLREHYSHLVGSLFLAGKAAWALSGYVTTESADYCMLINEWLWLRSQACLLRLEVD